MDPFYAFVLAMFTMSMISERISNFLKLFLPPAWVGNLKNIEADPRKEKAREAKLLFVSWISGLFTAILFLLILQDEMLPQQLSFFVKYKGYFAFYLGLSLFLSFGSKFWHDILDIIFLYKNAQRFLKNPDSYQLDNLEDVEKQLKQTGSDILKGAYAAQHDKLEKLPGVVAVAIGPGVLRIYIDKTVAPESITPELIWVDAQGLAHRIKTAVIVSGINRPFSSISGAMRNKSAGDRRGTLGCYVDDPDTNERYVLSCYHVMRSDYDPWNFFRGDRNGSWVLLEGEGQIPREAPVTYGCRNRMMDIAMAKIPSNYSPAMNPFLPKISDVEDVDPYSGALVHINGATSNGSKGYIYETRVEYAAFQYGVNNTQEFEDLFSIIGEDGKCPAQPGDSGALVYSANGKALGIILGGNEKLVYAMKITTLQRLLGVKIVKNTP